MIIDVIVTSCARPDVLSVAVNTFQEKIKTRHTLKYIILEDKVKDPERQSLGRAWIEGNKNLFDEIIYSDVMMGPYGFWQPTVKLCSTDYILHVEDDAEFIIDLYVDKALEFMKKNDDVAEIVFRRDIMTPKNIGNFLELNGVKLTKYKMFSIASGLYNTKLLKKILDVVGWDSEMHEAGILLPAANKLDLRRYILDHGKVHYVHVGGQKNYVKGNWKK